MSATAWPAATTGAAGVYRRHPPETTAPYEIVRAQSLHKKYFIAAPLTSRVGARNAGGMARYEIPAGERGPLRELVEPLLVLTLSGVAAWAYIRHGAEPKNGPVTPAVSSPASSTPPLAPPDTESLPLPATTPEPTPTPAAPEMPDVTAHCPLAPGPAPRYASVTRSWHEGGSGFDDAQREQSRTRVPMLVYFFTDWCGYCKAFDRNILGDSDVDRFLGERIVKVRINPETGRGERAVADRFYNNGYPALYIVLPGAEARKVSTTLRDRSYDPPGFVAGIQAQIDRQADSFLNEGASRRRAGDAAGAIEFLDAALALAPETARAYQERALAHEERGDLARALDDLATLLALDPARAEPYGLVAEALGRGGRHDDSVACWSRLLEMQPGHASAFLGRSRGHAARGDQARARADAQEACRLGEAQACEMQGSL